MRSDHGSYILTLAVGGRSWIETVKVRSWKVTKARKAKKKVWKKWKNQKKRIKYYVEISLDMCLCCKTKLLAREVHVHNPRLDTWGARDKYSATNVYFYVLFQESWLYSCHVLYPISLMWTSFFEQTFLREDRELLSVLT